MTLHPPPGPDRPRRRLVPTLLVVLALSTSSLGAAHGAPPDRGEDDRDIGPRTAPVHPGYDTPEHARASVRARRPPPPRQHAAGHASAVSDSSATSRATTTTVTGATAVTAAAATPLDPAVYGSWETLAYDLPLRAVHATALKNGNVLLIAGSGNSTNDNVVGSFKAYVLDPGTGTLTSVPVPYDAFCSFHLVDGNGDVLVFGGTTKYKSATSGWVGSDKVYKFVVDTSTWQAMPSMGQGRWYPGGTMDGDGKVYVYSGRGVTGAVGRTPEVYDPATRTWATLPARDLPLYPGLHTAKDGRVFYSGAHYGDTYATALPSTFHPVTGAKVDVNGPVLDLAHRNMAMSALVGSADEQLVWVAGGGFPAVASSYFIDIDAATPAAVAGPALPAPKSYLSMSNLPDLTTLETGGGAGTASPVFETSLLEPTTRTLRPMAPHDVPRTYHSSSLTTRDGRVLTFGGDPAGPADFVMKVEVFSPPYLFNGPRPAISGAPRAVTYGGTYAVSAAATDATLQYATLLRPGSATHATDSNQRSLRLVTRAVAGGVEITLPSNKNLAPPGWYFLSVIDSKGRPSVAQMVRLAPAVSTTRTLTVTAEADTMVKQASPSASYGTATTLLSDRQELSTAGSEVRSYLRFDVTGLRTGETVTGAQLSLRSLPTDGGTADGPAVWRTANTSTPAGVGSMTWNSGRPARSGTAAVGNIGPVGHDVRFATAVSGVTANGVATFELAPDSTDGLRFRSAESASTGDRPQLVLTVRTP